jgi:uncharacterized protein
MELEETKLEALKDYFNAREDVLFALLFGSAVRGAIREEGDVDIAVYFKPEREMEWEVNRRYGAEDRIGLDMERLLHKEIDLIVLNRAKAVLADEIVRKGKPIVIKDRGVFLDFFCLITDEAEYVRNSMISSYEEESIDSHR